jgi:hypothetical protein
VLNFQQEYTVQSHKTSGATDPEQEPWCGDVGELGRDLSPDSLEVTLANSLTGVP